MLKISGLTTGFDTNLVLDGIELEIPPGTTMVLLGESGCGKTTLLRCVAGLHPIYSGQIQMEQQIIAQDTKQIVPPERRGMGLLSQEGALFPHLSVAENVAFGLKSPQLRKIYNTTEAVTQRVQEVLELVGLGQYYKRKPFELSGGQQRRVALARALAPEPKLLLLDEPFTGLDHQLRTELRHQVKEVLQAVGITTLLVTHDFAEAFELADHIALLQRGNIVQAGAPQQIYEHPKSSAVAEFFGLPNIVAALKLEQTDTGTLVHTSFGKFSSAAIAHVAPADTQKLAVVIRPEQIVLDLGKGFANLFSVPPNSDPNATGSPQSLNSFEIKIENVVYQGANYWVQARTQSQPVENLEIFVPNVGTGTKIPALGMTVTARVVGEVSVISKA